MRVYLDTEFTQFTQPHLISLGLAAADGSEFYAAMKNFPRQQCSEFVREIVLPIIEHWPSVTLDRRKMRESVSQWLNSCVEPTEIVCDFATDAELLIDLIGGQSEHDLRRFNISRITVLLVSEYEQLEDAVDTYFTQPRQWPRHHALEDARALRHAGATLQLTAASETDRVQHAR